jgi:NDP-sugar pyrophosphorylase family protein
MIGSTDTVILAGGLGTRLQGVLPEGCPKAMAPVNGRPFVELQVEYLYAQGVRRIVLALGYGADRITARLEGRGWPADLRLRCVTEPKPLGTGGALRFAFPQLASDPVLALNGDSLCDADLAELLAFHARSRAGVSLVLARVPDTGRYGRVECDTGGRVTRFVEKAASAGPGLVNCGVYAVRLAVLGAMPPDAPFSWERDVLERRVGQDLYGIEAARSFIDIGTPESLRAAGAFLAGQTAAL